jgi:endonuclease/exonuclease/phosphatase family metal-dependent hydrolase
MTFNIQHCRDYVKRVIDIDLMADAIRKCAPDIVGLNEVYGKSENGKNQAEAIAEKLGYHYYFGQAITYQGIPYGNAILSKRPFSKAETIMIPDPEIRDNPHFETRCIIRAEFTDPSLTVLVSHFGLMKSEQENAIAVAVKLIRERNTPLVLMGDFNMVPDDITLAPIRLLLTDTLPKPIPSYPSIDPVKKIDYLFVSPEMTIIDAGIGEIIASDHRPHTAVVTFP